MNLQIKHDPKEVQRIRRMQRFEHPLWKQGFRCVAGVDEAGRGPLAGPVVAAAVIFTQQAFIPKINDSKKLSESLREWLFEQIQYTAMCFSVGVVSSAEIDEINILQATYKAMQTAISNLEVRPEYILVDGSSNPEFTCPCRAIVGGDGKCFSIAAASIMAKVTRDRMMKEYDMLYPEYGFANNKGYGTQKHVQALRQYGPSPIHRTSFKMSGWT